MRSSCAAKLSNSSCFNFLEFFIRCAWLSLLICTHISPRTYVWTVLYRSGGILEKAVTIVDMAIQSSAVLLSSSLVVRQKLLFSFLLQLIVWNIDWSLVFASSFAVIRVSKLKSVVEFVTIQRSWWSIRGCCWGQRFIDCTKFLWFFLLKQEAVVIDAS